MKSKKKTKLAPKKKLKPKAKSKQLFGCMKGKAIIHGDIMAPLNVQWNATL